MSVSDGSLWRIVEKMVGSKEITKTTLQTFTVSTPYNDVPQPVRVLCHGVPFCLYTYRASNVSLRY